MRILFLHAVCERKGCALNLLQYEKWERGDRRRGRAALRAYRRNGWQCLWVKRNSRMRALLR